MLYYNTNKHEIKTDESQVVVYIPAVGLEKEDISVKTENSILIIEGDPKNRGKPFVKKFELDESLYQKGIKCNLKNGELKITIPKKQMKTRKIKIE
jgi:HSP20 family molecular chaperone IbpA